MYQTGTKYNLETRMHQLLQSGADFTPFVTEASGYAPTVSGEVLIKWEHELRRCWYEISGVHHSGAFLTGITY